MKLERKKINSGAKDYALFLFPSDPSIFWISQIVEEIFDLAENNNKIDIMKILGRKYSAEVITGAFNEIERVEKRGFLNKGMRNLWKKVELPKDAGDMRIFSVNLHLSHDCNLSCGYCYANKGNFGLDNPEKSMSWAVAKKAIDWLFEVNKNNSRPLSICFFGGEPLLNIDVIEKILKYIHKEKKQNYPNAIRFATMTNGTLIKEQRIVKILAEYDVKPTISIDASKKAHNKNRPYRNGRGSYDDILLGIDRLRTLAPDLPFRVRSVIGPEDLLDDFFYNKASLGISSSEFSIRYDLLSSIEETRRILNKMEREFWKYSRDPEMSKKRSIFAGDMFLQFFLGNQVSGETCGAGIKRFTIIPNGEIHVCSGKILDDKTYLGDIYRGIDSRRLKEIYEVNAALIERRNYYCGDCWVRNFCCGFCVLHDKPAAERKSLPICDFIRKTFEFSIISYAFMGDEDLRSLARYNTADTALTSELNISEKIRLLCVVRDVYNNDLKYIKQITPTMSR